MNKGFTHESTYNESKEWYTPRWIFDAIGVEFDLDPCHPGSDICSWIPVPNIYTFREDGLLSQWSGNVWLNPPYGSDTPRWMARLAKHGQGIALVFARPDTKWFHDYVPLADAVCFVKGRIAFVKADKAYDYAHNLYLPKGGCGAASMLIAYGQQNAEALFSSNLGLAFAVGKAPETFSTGKRFAGVKVDAQRDMFSDTRRSVYGVNHRLKKINIGGKEREVFYGNKARH